VTILSGTETTATLQVDADASGPALLMIGHAPSGGAAQSEAASVAPGATGSVSITPVGFGILRVHVGMHGQTDRGVLTVHPPGPEDAPLQGDTNQGYVVVEP